MRQRKRVTATRKETSPLASTINNGPDGKTVVPLLQNITENCKTMDLDPSSCIPLYLVRDCSHNAVQKLKTIINGDAISKDNFLQGMVSGTPTSIVVQLTDGLSYIIDNWLKDHSASIQDANALKKEHSSWYGIIDGCQLHGAIMELRESIPSKWKNFMWRVFCVESSFKIDDYRRLARIQNERNKSMYHFECTVYDLLKGLRIEYDNLYELYLKKSRIGPRGVNVKHEDVASRYDGGNHQGSTSVKQAVSVASRLSPRAIEAIGVVVNTECADIIVRNSSLNYHFFSSASEAISHHDCRLFKSFVCFGALKSAKNFMNALKDGKEEAQINTIYRLKHWSELNRYRSAQHKVVGEQFKLAVMALEEERKFLDFIEVEEWPNNMETTRENILRTTICDADLVSNSGNDTDVLTAIWSCFKRLYPARAKGFEETSESTTDAGPDVTEEDSVKTSGGIHLADTNKTKSNSKDQGGETDVDKVEAEEREKREIDNNRIKEMEIQKEIEKNRVLVEKKRVANLRSEADKHLSESGIFSHCLTFHTFMQQIWSSSTNSRVDLVVSSIPHDHDIESLASIPAYCENVLKSGSYAFFIVSEKQFSILQSKFKEKSFKVLDHSYKIIYNSKTIQRRALVDFPQVNGDIAIIAKTPGDHPDGFSPSFCSKKNGGQTSAAIQFASVVNINTCTDKLKKPNDNTSLFKGEKSVDLFEHIIMMLSPSCGSVLDPIAGPLTTGIASLRTGRSAILIESNHLYFNYGVGRLRIYATPDATMQFLNDYSNPIDVESVDENMITECGSNQKKEGSNVESISDDQSAKRRKISTNNSDDVMGEDETVGAETLLMIRSS